MLLIIGNCLTLALFRPKDPSDSHWNRQLRLADLSLNGLFSVELVMRMVSEASVKSYLKSPWNLFDLAMVVIGWTELIPSSDGKNAIKALRALRALRPLRTITRVQSLRAIVVCFLESIPLLLSTVRACNATQFPSLFLVACFRGFKSHPFNSWLRAEYIYQISLLMFHRSACSCSCWSCLPSRRCRSSRKRTTRSASTSRSAHVRSMHVLLLQ